MTKENTPEKETLTPSEPVEKQATQIKKSAEDIKAENIALKESLAQQGSILQTMQEQIENLRQASDVNKLERVEEANKPVDKGIYIKVTEYRGDGSDKSRLVVSWRNLENYVMPVKDKGVIEKQVYELTLSDGSKVVVGENTGYKEFQEIRRDRPSIYVPEEDIKYLMSRDKGVLKIEGIEYVNVTWNGEKIKIDSKFIN